LKLIKAKIRGKKIIVTPIGSITNKIDTMPINTNTSAITIDNELNTAENLLASSIIFLINSDEFVVRWKL